MGLSVHLHSEGVGSDSRAGHCSLGERGVNGGSHQIQQITIARADGTIASFLSLYDYVYLLVNRNVVTRDV